jgi:transposase InsO family protein
VFKAKTPRPHLRPIDRIFWSALQRSWRDWANALIIVKPETVVGWHRRGFKLYWYWKSRHGLGRPAIDPELKALIQQMASDNVGWGAPRIHGELLKLGFDVSEITVSRYMPRRLPSPDAIQRWKAFLRNHRDVVAAMDFFVVPTATWHLLYGFFVIHHGRRLVLHFNATFHPGERWLCQQMREAFSGDEPVPKYIILDRDSSFSPLVLQTLRNMGIKIKRTSVKSPWQNGVAERWIASIRRDMLHHVIVIDESHLCRLVRSYIIYYHEDRTHLSLAKDSPRSRPMEERSDVPRVVVALPRVGGLHHRYTWQRAA